MSARKTLLVLFVPLVFCACSPYMHTSWKAPGVAQKRYSKVLVVGVVPDVALRRTIEDQAISELKRLGYQAVSALKEYGPGGLASISQEKTFLTLSNDGIDALITLVLLDKSKEKENKLSVSKHASALYYFNRIWNYQKIEAAPAIGAPISAHYLWEGILFDLRTLEAQYAAQTKSFRAAALTAKGAAYGNALVRNMVKKRVVTSQQRYAVKPPF